MAPSAIRDFVNIGGQNVCWDWPTLKQVSKIFHAVSIFVICRVSKSFTNVLRSVCLQTFFRSMLAMVEAWLSFGFPYRKSKFRACAVVLRGHRVKGVFNLVTVRGNITTVSFYETRSEERTKYAYRRLVIKLLFSDERKFSPSTSFNSIYVLILL